MSAIAVEEVEREMGFEPTTLCLGSGPFHRGPEAPCLQGISPDLAPSAAARQRVAFGTSFQFGRSVTSLDLDSKIEPLNTIMS